MADEQNYKDGNNVPTLPAVVEHMNESLSDSKTFRRPNKAVAMRVAKGGTLTLLSRKIFNVVLYHTQKAKVPGVGAPIDLPIYKKFYWVPLSTFIDDVKFDSNAISYLRESFENLKTINLHVEDEIAIGSASLLAEFKIINRSGKKGEPRYVGWALAPSIEAMAMNPELYTTSSLYYLTTLNSTASLGLYETTKRYANSPGGLTMRKPVSWWYEHLKGVPVGTEMPEYKIFKRDTLKPAMAEVNALTDVEVVELIQHKEGRKVTELQFRVANKQQTDLDLPTPPLINPELIEKMEALGLSKREAEDVSVTYQADVIMATLLLVEARLTNEALSPINSPAAFFRSGLRDGYAAAASKVDKAKKKKKADSDKPAALPAPADPEAIAARAAAIEIFDALDETARDSVLEAIAKNNMPLFKMVQKNPGGRATRLSLASFLAENPGFLQ